MAEVVEDETPQTPPPPEHEPGGDAAEAEQKEKKRESFSTTSSSLSSTSPPISSFSNLSLNIWPPSQRTRDAVLRRLIETLSSTSVLSQRYGSVPLNEASTLARQIEEEAFSAASVSFPVSAASAAFDDDGMEILQVYSREISKRMLDTVKARAAPSAASPVPSSGSAPEASPVTTADADAAPASDASADASEEISSVASESSHA